MPFLGSDRGRRRKGTLRDHGDVRQIQEYAETPKGEAEELGWEAISAAAHGDFSSGEVGLESVSPGRFRFKRGRSLLSGHPAGYTRGHGERPKHLQLLAIRTVLWNCI